MNQEVKKEWIEALRSGEYRQGDSYLASKDRHDDNYKFCCLGVLCELAYKKGIVTRTEDSEDDGGDKYYCYGKDQCREYLPDEVINWANLKDDSPCLPDESEFGTGSLTEINDSGDYNFQAIAKLIEKYL